VGIFWQADFLTILRDLGFTCFPGQQLGAIIGKPFRSLDRQVTRFEFVGNDGKDAGFQVSSSQFRALFASDPDQVLPDLWGKGEVKRVR